MRFYIDISDELVKQAQKLRKPRRRKPAGLTPGPGRPLPAAPKPPPTKSPVAHNAQPSKGPLYSPKFAGASVLPQEVLLGTVKEATAYIYQIRALRNSSPAIRRSLDEAMLKQAYSWDEFKSGLGNYSPASYGIAGAGAGSLVAALNEARKDERDRNWMNVLYGGGIGAGLGAGGAYVAGPEGADVQNLFARARGKETVHGTGAGTSVVSPELTPEQKRRDVPPNPKIPTPGVFGDNLTDQATNIATLPGQTIVGAIPGGDAVLEGRWGPGAAGVATSGALLSAREAARKAGKSGDVARAVKETNRATRQAVAAAAPSAVAETVANTKVVARGAAAAEALAIKRWFATADPSQINKVLKGGSVKIPGLAGKFTKEKLKNFIGATTVIGDTGAAAVRAGRTTGTLLPNVAPGLPGMVGTLDDITPTPGAWRKKMFGLLGDAKTPKAVQQRTQQLVAAGQITVEEAGVLTRAARSGWARWGSLAPGFIGLAASLLNEADASGPE